MVTSIREGGIPTPSVLHDVNIISFAHIPFGVLYEDFLIFKDTRPDVGGVGFLAPQSRVRINFVFFCDDPGP